MFMDLRKASVSKPKIFINALIEYLTDELKNNNVKCRKKVSYIDIKIDRPIENKYSNLIVDCFNGNIYLRGKDVNDKCVLRMSRFNLGNRESDAVYCAEGACKQIKRYLNKINNVEDNNSLIATRIDLRKKLQRTASTLVNCGTTNNTRIDLRGKIAKTSGELIDMRLKNKRSKIDLRTNTKTAYNRDYAVTIVDGKIYEGDTHGECVTKFLNEIGIEGIEFFDRIDLRENLGFNFYSQFAAAHVDGDKIYLDKMSLENISPEQAIDILKTNFQDSTIYDYDSRKQIANNKLKDLRKIAEEKDEFLDSLMSVEDNWDDKEEYNKEIRQYLEESGWRQSGAGIYINIDYKLVDFIHGSADQIVLYTEKPVDMSITDNIGGVNCISDTEIEINNLFGLEILLEKLKEEK